MIIKSENSSHVVIEASSVNEITYDACKAVMEYGNDTTARGLTFRELHPATVILTNPTNRHLLFPFRLNNPFAQMAETLWVLAGRNDVDWLSRYLPRALDFSDEAPEEKFHFWRAGYGPRLRQYGPQNTDQLAYVVDALKKDPGTRQAVINIWDAHEDAKVFYTGGSRDIPCNDLLHFMIRDGKLDLSVYVRSNDVIWGLTGVNLMEWSVLHEVVAIMLGVKVGTYYQHIGSLHIYNWHFDRARAIYGCSQHGLDEGMENFDIYSTITQIKHTSFLPYRTEMDVDTLDVMLYHFFEFETILRERDYTSMEDLKSKMSYHMTDDRLSFDWAESEMGHFFAAIAVYNLYLNKENPKFIEGFIRSCPTISGSLDGCSYSAIDRIIANWLHRRFRVSFYENKDDHDTTFQEAIDPIQFMETKCNKPECLGPMGACKHFCGRPD